MCGIYGIVKFDGTEFKNNLLRIILKKLAIASKIRGRDATGYAFGNEDAINIFKHNVYANQFTQLENYKRVVRDNMPSSGKLGWPYAVIGHTRHKTQGSPLNPDNNHPIRTGSIVGVHNGMIYNDDEVFDWLKEESKGEVKRIAQVDSEAIFAAVNYIAKTLKWPGKYTNSKLVGHVSNPTTQAITKAGSKLAGGYACALLDSDNPYKTWLFRGNGVMAVHYYRKEKLLIFASVAKFIEDAVEAYNFSDPDEIAVDAFSGLCIDSKNNKYSSFKLEQADIRRGRHINYSY